MKAKRLSPGSRTPTAGASIGPCLMPERTWLSERPAATGNGGPAVAAVVAELVLLPPLDPPQAARPRTASTAVAAAAARNGRRGMPRHSRVPGRPATPAGAGPATTEEDETAWQNARRS